MTRGAALGLLFGLGGAPAGGIASASPLLAQTSSRGRVPCLHYEPALARLSGTLERTDTGWVLRLVDPICTTGPAETSRSERDVREVGLVARGTMLARFADLAGTTVTASGTLSHAAGAHQKIAVLLAVQGLVGRGHKETATLPPPPQVEGEAPASKDPMEAVVRALESRISVSAARELAAIQARWQELAERDCRWEVSLSMGGKETPSLYAACLDRARRERLHRLEGVSR